MLKITVLDLDEMVRKGTPLSKALRQVRRNMARLALEIEGGNATSAADRLGIHRNSMSRLLKKGGLDSAALRSAIKARKRAPGAISTAEPKQAPDGAR